MPLTLTGSECSVNEPGKEHNRFSNLSGPRAAGATACESDRSCTRDVIAGADMCTCDRSCTRNILTGAATCACDPRCTRKTEVNSPRRWGGLEQFGREGGYHAVMVAVVGVVLAGGRSTRMGTSKAALEWHGSTMVRRVAGIVARVVDGPVFVVAAPGQRLPHLPPDIAVVADPQEGRGPLQGLAVGLGTAADVAASVAFVCSTDVPLLHPAVVRRVLDGLHDGVDVALPAVDGRRQPLVAAYRTALASAVAGWVAAGERRVTVVAERSRVNPLTSGDLLADEAVRAADPDLLSLSNLNGPQDYRTARARPAPAVTVRSGDHAEHIVRAATVVGAAAATGLTFARVTALLDGVPVADGTTPLVAGDVVTFSPAGPVDESVRG